MLIALYKPFGVLSQFTSDGSNHTPLSVFKLPPRVYPIGRLDADSEGLLLLSDERPLVERLLSPHHAHPREYWVQVEGTPSEESLNKLAAGGLLLQQQHRTRPCRVWSMNDFHHEYQLSLLPERVPPIRFRKTVPTSWIGIELVEGKNRQVRRMTAAVGLPTLRLVRVRIGAYCLPLQELSPGAWRVLTNNERADVLSLPLS
jgi:23S rRNA pseudouridine2457 synthase